MLRRLTPTLICLVVLAGCGSSEPKSAAPSTGDTRAALKGAPAPLARLHAQSNQLLGGGADAFRRRIAALRGYPVVVNKWGSWCGPCRSEFPFFQKQSVAKGRKIAFLGVDGNDNDKNAKKFLARYPVSFPSYVDPDLKIAGVLKATLAFPSTAFFDRRGRLSYVKQGSYATEEKLAADIAKYAR
jgi:cytochrome c biogenesis protein CcmG, thiol:disulfide interchange protein DsbE